MQAQAASPRIESQPGPSATNTAPTNQRPTMRRKSSAQNLLASFKPNSSNSNANNNSSPSSAVPTPSPSPIPIPAPPQPSSAAPMQMSLGGPGQASSSVASSFSFASTPTAYTPVQKEWDNQSLHSDGASQPPQTASNSAFSQGATVEYLRDLVQKRIITLTYMRNVHDGRSHWFHTIMMSRPELDRVFSNAAMKKRTSRFAILAMSLATLFDVHQPQDLMRGLLNTLTEYEQSKEDKYNDPRPAKMRIFRRRKGAPGMSDFSLGMPIPDTSETSYLMTPHIPFPLDYHQTLLSLLDVLSEVYSKLSKFLGPSPFPHATQHMLGPLGLLSPHPGVSYLFSGADAAPVGDGDGLWGIAHGGIGPGPGVAAAAAPGAGGAGAGGVPGASGFHGGFGGQSNGGVGMGGGGPLASPPPSWTPALGEMVLKVDTKFKKIISTLLKDLDAFARNEIKDELASLDPLLRNVAVADESRATYDFEGTI